MIRVEPTTAPPGFDGGVRQDGLNWLNHPNYGQTRRRARRPESCWTQWEPCARFLCDGFAERCGYSASFTLLHHGQIDHFVSWAECKQNGCHHLAYEWTNFRWLDGRINQVKSKVDRRRGSQRLLDPFEVEDDWFELDLGKELLCETDRVPSDMAERVRFTLDQLDLRDGRIVQAQRKAALDEWRAGANFELIDRRYPLVARAIRRLEETPDERLTVENRRIKRELREARRVALELSLR